MFLVEQQIKSKNTFQAIMQLHWCLKTLNGDIYHWLVMFLKVTTMKKKIIFPSESDCTKSALKSEIRSKVID